MTRLLTKLYSDLSWWEPHWTFIVKRVFLETRFSRELKKREFKRMTLSQKLDAKSNYYTNYTQESEA